MAENGVQTERQIETLLRKFWPERIITSKEREELQALLDAAGYPADNSRTDIPCPRCDKKLSRGIRGYLVCFIGGDGGCGERF